MSMEGVERLLSGRWPLTVALSGKIRAALLEARQALFHTEPKLVGFDGGAVAASLLACTLDDAFKVAIAFNAANRDQVFAQVADEMRQEGLEFSSHVAVDLLRLVHDAGSDNEDGDQAL